MLVITPFNHHHDSYFKSPLHCFFSYSKHSRHWTKSLHSYLTSWMQFLLLLFLVRNFKMKLRDGFHVNVGLVLWLFKLYTSEYLKVLGLFLEKNILILSFHVAFKWWDGEWIFHSRWKTCYKIDLHKGWDDNNMQPAW